MTSTTSKQKKMAIVYRKVDELIPYARNARTHDDAQVAQIAASIKEFGFRNPVLIDTENGIVAGHGRILGARKLGMEEVPCVVCDGWTDAQKRAYIIADNKIALNSGWDTEMLRLELEEIDDSDVSVDLTGFSLEEIKDLTPDVEKTGLTDQDEVPEVQEDAITKPGDIWLMGRHRLMCGDSTSIDSIFELCQCDSESPVIDLWLTDPPYNVEYTGKTKDALTIKNDSMDDSSFHQFLVDAFTSASAAMKPGASFYIWHADSEGYNFRSACRDACLEVRQCLIWVKNALVMGRQDYQWKHEPCLYGWKEGGAHNWFADRSQTTTLEFDRPSRNGEHPTMKPVALFEYQIRNSSRPESIVLDSFGGSGTTLIACEKSGRFARLMELDPHYCDVIVRRWQEFTGGKAVLESTGKTFDEQVESK